MTVVVLGSELPGLRWGGYGNVHAGLCVRGRAAASAVVVPGRSWRAAGLVAGDAPSARWECAVAVREDAGGGLDFGGPFVRGSREDRHLGLAWGDLLPDGTLDLFRGTKLRLGDVDPAAVRAADRPGYRLVARLGLSSPQGGPRSARVRPPDVVWSVEPAEGSGR